MGAVPPPSSPSHSLAGTFEGLFAPSAGELRAPMDALLKGVVGDDKFLGSDPAVEVDDGAARRRQPPSGACGDARVPVASDVARVCDDAGTQGTMGNTVVEEGAESIENIRPLLGAPINSRVGSTASVWGAGGFGRGDNGRKVDVASVAGTEIQSPFSPPTC
jgi:hypothetical protein